MSMNIKNGHVHAMVREASERTGMTQTSVVEEAMRLYLDRLDASRRAGELDEVVARMQRHWRESANAAFGAEDLYDPATGLPS